MSLPAKIRKCGYQSFVGCASRSKLVGYLDNTNYDLMGVTILIHQTKLNHGIVSMDVAFYMRHLIILEVFLNILLKNNKCICKVNFEGTRIVGGSLHSFNNFNFGERWAGYDQRIRAEAHVNPLPKAAKQITSFSFTLPSDKASLNAMGMEAAVVLP